MKAKSYYRFILFMVIFLLLLSEKSFSQNPNYDNRCQFRASFNSTKNCVEVEYVNYTRTYNWIGITITARNGYTIDLDAQQIRVTVIDEKQVKPMRLVFPINTIPPEDVAEIYIAVWKHKERVHKNIHPFGYVLTGRGPIKRIRPR